jgi:RHS repeat-associated protein
VTDPASVQTYTTDYAYDAVGNRLTKNTDNYIYNNVDQLITENSITYTYDLNGNLETKTDASGTTTYSYDYDNRLVQVIAPNSSPITYKYDVDGNRVEATTTAGTTRYLVDTNRSLAQILAEYRTDGTPLASYAYADDLISMTRNGQTYFYHFDGLGSTRLLTDITGAVADIYSYDAFGNLITRTGTTENPFLFSGQQYDPNIGFYYLRARYYQPTNGRFTSLDPFEGDPYAPMSLHKYLYAANDSVNKIDPSGLFFSLVEFMVADSIRSTLAEFQANLGFGLIEMARGNTDDAVWSFVENQLLSFSMLALGMAFKKGSPEAKAFIQKIIEKGEKGQQAVMQKVLADGQFIYGSNVRYTVFGKRGEADIITDKAFNEIKNYEWSKYSLATLQKRFGKQIENRMRLLREMGAQFGLPVDESSITFWLNKDVPLPEGLMKWLQDQNVVVKTYYP